MRTYERQRSGVAAERNHPQLDAAREDKDMRKAMIFNEGSQQTRAERRWCSEKVRRPLRAVLNSAWGPSGPSWWYWW